MHTAADEFLLSDPANEKKWKFKLVDAVKRAKQNKGQIFKGIGFYVTTRVLQGLEKNLLRNVVEAHGGWVSPCCPFYFLVTDFQQNSGVRRSPLCVCSRPEGIPRSPSSSPVKQISASGDL